MAHISGINRSELLLLPEAVDNYVGPDNLVRFIEAFGDGLDLAAAGFERVAANWKRPVKAACCPINADDQKSPEISPLKHRLAQKHMSEEF